MDIKILDSWLREHVDTTAKPADIARCVSLSGPTFDRTHKVKVMGKTDYLYDIEVTTNRVDAASVRGIAREVSVILPEFGFKAKLKPLKVLSPKSPVKPVPLTIKTTQTLTNRVMGIVLEVDVITDSPKWIKERLIQTGIRSLNAAVDITNYVMTEIGHPTHVFDYDLVAPKMIIRESQKGETIVSLDNKKYTLPGGDIVIDNGNGQIIDLPGIIGTKNSVVNKDTKRILFFLETNDPIRIRRTSMTLGIRTVAATLNEKGVDPERAETALLRGIELFKDILKARPISAIHDTYYKKTIKNPVAITHAFIEKRLGVEIPQSRVEKILTNLGFSVSYNKSKDTYTATPPSWRAKDIAIKEDILEEVARIYGYHNLPSILMAGIIPDPQSDSPFGFELNLKRTLKETGGNEVYTYSLISEKQASKDALTLKNPLGSDYSRLRTSLKEPLVAAAKDNSRNTEIFHLFEIAKVYIPVKHKLPDEIVMAAGIIVNSDYRHAKGIVEHLLQSQNIKATEVQKSLPHFDTQESLVFNIKKTSLGSFGRLKNSKNYYYEFEVQKLQSFASQVKRYSPISKFPPQIEDITFVVSNTTKIGELMDTISTTSPFVSHIELADTYNDNYTFRVWYQDESKTLTDEEVSRIHALITTIVKDKHGITTSD